MTTKSNRRSGDARKVIVDAILASTVASSTLRKKAQVRRYLSAYFANVPFEDLEGRSEAVMASIAMDHLEFGATRRKGEALLRIYSPTEEEHGYESAFTFVEMVNDDMPFLVDSVAAAINRHNLGVHITVHPIIPVRRNRKGELVAIADSDDDDAHSESFIRFAITRVTDPEVLESLREEITKVLSDVRVAVRDWGKMRNRMRETRDMLDLGPKGADPLVRSESQALLDWMADEHFTFLGYREYSLERRGKRLFLTAVPGTGLGILSDDAPRPGPRGPGAGRAPARADRTHRRNAATGAFTGLADSDQGQFALDGTSLRLSRLRRRQDLRRGRQGRGRTPFSRPPDVHRL